MNSIYQVSSGQLTPFINTFSYLGSPIDSLLGSVGLSSKILEDPSLMIPEFAAWKMVSVVSQKEGIDDLGVLVASIEQQTCFGELGQAMVQSLSLFTALGCLVTQLLKHANYKNYWLSETDRYIYLCRVGTPGIDVGVWQMEQYVLSYFLSVIRGYLGANWAPDFIHVQSAAPINQKNVFGNTNVEYSKPYGAIPIDKKLFVTDLDQSLIRRSLHRQTSGRHVSELLSEMITSQVFENHSSFDNVSNALGINNRQLQRILEREGTNFRELKGHAMTKIACELLLNDSLSILDISIELGYKNPKNFTRAFKIITGITPSEYRSTSFN